MTEEEELLRFALKFSLSTGRTGQFDTKRIFLPEIENRARKKKGGEIDDKSLLFHFNLHLRSVRKPPRALLAQS